MEKTTTTKILFNPWWLWRSASSNHQWLCEDIDNGGWGLHCFHNCECGADAHSVRSAKVNKAFFFFSSHQKALPQHPPSEEEMVDCSSTLLKLLCGMWVSSLVRTTISLVWAVPDGLRLWNVEVTSCWEEQWHLAAPQQHKQGEGFLEGEKKHCYIIVKIRSISVWELMSWRLLNCQNLQGNRRVFINSDTWWWRHRLSVTFSRKNEKN